MLSSDPERSPVEPGIVPLDFALVELRLATPCRSCEGHPRDDGTWVRGPQVWFYGESSVVPELIANHVSKLTYSKQLLLPWHVEVCPHSECGSTTFVLICRLPDPENTSQADVQADVRTLAFTLRDGLRAEAERRIAG